MTSETLAPKKGRRVIIDLTPAAARETERIADDLGEEVADVFRQSLSLFRLYLNAKQDGKHLAIVDSNNPPKEITRIEPCDQSN